MSLAKTGIKEIDQYCEQVKAGNIPACLYVRQAVDRHYKDLKNSKKKNYPYYFEPKAALHFFQFCETFVFHYKGLSAGEPLKLEPWQKFVWGSIYGWMKKERLKGNPIRRFREGIIEVNKKNGKSFLLAAQGLYALDYDNEPGAEIYGLAKNRTHAMKLSYAAAASIVKNNPNLLEQYRVKEGIAMMGVYCEANDSYFEPLSSKPESTDGLNVHLSIHDETKDWTDFEMYDIMKDGTAGRPNPMVMNITTAGADMSSLGYERRQFLIKILNGSVEDETTFGIIYTIDDEDKYKKEYWSDPKIWRKANPNFNVSVFEEYFQEQMPGCRESQRKLNSFLTKHLGLWISSMDRYFSVEDWNKCENKSLKSWKDKFANKPCYVFIDLASKKDIAPMYALFLNGQTKDKKNKYAVFGINFLPSDVVSEKQVGKRASYNAWSEQGYFYLTNGIVTDYDAIKEELKTWNKLFNIQAVAFDEWNASHLASDVENMRMKVLLVKQTTKMLSDPMKTLDALISEKRIAHNGDPVLTWAIGNVVAKEDPNENVFPRKEHRDNKIDPAVAIINLFALEIESPLPLNTSRRVPKVW